MNYNRDMLLYLILFIGSGVVSSLFFYTLKKRKKMKKQAALQNQVALLSKALYKEILIIDPSLKAKNNLSYQDLEKYYQLLRGKNDLPLHKLHYTHNEFNKVLHTLRSY